ncbi:DUF4102 domain-containing protein [Campylobacter sp. faydin G-24]|uniref:DUF4102 domain-containing protein n=1 Tax=Campylobacter anatolicus TaxID=2829105 RepID=A0ABS5HJ87_9BACT|nr:DUF4102 domain-containing protein [Campylobacter anatolicus]MBR8464203.1 DUF4102 domain-containing protein [Campylobacter anatolicus]
MEIISLRADYAKWDKDFYFIYELKSKSTGRYKRISLGAYPTIMARQKRLEFQKMLASGDEPISKTSFESVLRARELSRFYS